MMRVLTNTSPSKALKAFGNLSLYNEGGHKTTLARELPTLVGERLDVAMWRRNGVVQVEVYTNVQGHWFTSTYIARC
jgi:hypothetical protein